MFLASRIFLIKCRLYLIQEKVVMVDLISENLRKFLAIKISNSKNTNLYIPTLYKIKVCLLKYYNVIGY